MGKIQKAAYRNREARKKAIEKENKSFRIQICIVALTLIFVIAFVLYFVLFAGKNNKNIGEPPENTTVVTLPKQSTTTETTTETTAETTAETTTQKPTEKTTERVTERATERATEEKTKAVDATPIDDFYDDNISVSFTPEETKKWYLKLIGPYSEPLPKNYAPSLTNVEGYPIHSKIVKSYKAMKKAAENDGVNIYIISGYRTYQRQENNFNTRYNQYKNQGYSDKEAYAKTAAIIAVPGTSEHHLGLSLDLNSLYQTFGSTREGKWLAKNAHKYGFILRYEADTTDITGIVYEPWHFRYVSVGHAEKIHDMGITLEEYIDWLKTQ